MTRIIKTVARATDKAFTLGRMYAEAQKSRELSYSISEALADIDEVNRVTSEKLERKFGVSGIKENEQ